jgi:pimeloyl-ACP methyl ester carboxylesterase
MPSESGISPSSDEAGPAVRRSTLSLDVSAAAPAGCNRLVADVFAPEGLGPRPRVWLCVPGGGLNRRYFDLQVVGQAETFSMARYLAAGGDDLVVTIDPPGVGESDVPDDGYTLSPDTVADVLAAAVHTIEADLGNDGLPVAHVGRTTPRTWIGLGHSAGALLVACQQARHGSYDAVALLGFSASGLPEVLNDQERLFAGKPAELAAAVARLSAARFGEPLPQWSNHSTEDLEPSARAAVDDALSRASSRLLALVGMTAIVPGSVQPRLDELSLPIFVGLGEHDLAGGLDALPAQLPACGDLTLFRLEGAGHNHNVAVNRTVLWDRVAQWAHSVAPDTPRYG